MHRAAGPGGDDGGMTTLHTIGHGTLEASELLRLLRDARIEALVDVRSFPGSRRNPHFGREEMERWVPEGGVEYRWERRLGGFRKPDPASPNTGLRHPAFRAYADHMATPEFASALAELLDAAATRPTAVMCSETLWWRCHRRLLADAAVLLGGAEVLHLFHDGAVRPHRPSPEAVVAGGRLTYPAAGS